MGRDVVAVRRLICYGDEAHVTTIAVDPEPAPQRIGTR
jgi:ribosomal protein S18 acetylase RimI-like enzyme